VADPNLADAIACLREYGWTYAADTFESQAARIAELEAALRTATADTLELAAQICEAVPLGTGKGSWGDGALLCAAIIRRRRALASKEVDRD